MSTQRRQFGKERVRQVLHENTSRDISDQFRAASLFVDDVARRHMRALDLEMLREITKADIPAGVRGYVERTLAWLTETEGAVLGGRQREVFEKQVKKIRMGVPVVDRVVQGGHRHVTTRDSLSRERGRAEKLRDRASMATNTPWMADAGLLPKRPPGRVT